jgi:hypothetical protein
MFGRLFGLCHNTPLQIGKSYQDLGTAEVDTGDHAFRSARFVRTMDAVRLSQARRNG